MGGHPPTFAVLSTAEAELVGLIDGMVLGDSMTVITDILENGCWERGEGRRTLYGDNMSSVLILHRPDGPWRTRHLRLRAHVLKERIEEQVWTAHHIPGKELASDFLTKMITVKAQWPKFFEYAGMCDAGVTQAAVAKIGAAVKGLSAMSCLAASTAKTKIARDMTMAALSMYIAAQVKGLRRDGVLSFDQDQDKILSEDARTLRSRSRDPEPDRSCLDVSPQACVAEFRKQRKDNEPAPKDVWSPTLYHCP